MPRVVALNWLGPERQASIPSCFRRRERRRLSACMLTVAFFAVILAGCNQHARGRPMSGTPNAYSSASSGSRTLVPLPNKALLGRLPEPDCKFKTSEADTDDRQKLDYERQCYRHAEIIARLRLLRLQGSVDKTIRALKGSKRGGS
jgi:hypothetical protein